MAHFVAQIIKRTLICLAHHFHYTPTYASDKSIDCILFIYLFIFLLKKRNSSKELEENNENITNCLTYTGSSPPI